MSEECYIKDEYGKFQGRKPGCKMEKGQGASPRKTKPTKEEIEALYRKPSLTEEERRMLIESETLDSDPIFDPVSIISGSFAGVGAKLAAKGILSAVRGFTANLATGTASDVLMKYADEKIPGAGIATAVLAAAVLGHIRGTPKHDAKRSIETAVRNNQVLPSDKLGTVAGDIIDAVKSGKSTSVLENKVVSTGRITKEEAVVYNQKVPGQRPKVVINKNTETYATGGQIKHSLKGHGDIVTKQKLNPGQAVKSEEDMRSKSLTPEDYKQIPKLRKKAINDGTFVYQPPRENKGFNSFRYRVTTTEGTFEFVDRHFAKTNSLAFWTMWKNKYPKLK